MKWLIAFDLDGTLAESKRPLSEDMAAILARLLAITDVAVISGGDWPQFEKQIASRLPAGVALDRLWLMPTTGTKLYRFINGAWRAVYAELFDDAEKAAEVFELLMGSEVAPRKEFLVSNGAHTMDLDY